MLKNITLSAEESLVRKARQRAAERQTTLNAEFRQWLLQYAARPDAVAVYQSLVEQLGHCRSGRRFTREELNER